MIQKSYAANHRSLIRPGILVVEDDPGILGLLNLVLHHVGFRVFPAITPEKGLEVLRSHSSVVTTALVDLQDPGWTAATLLHSMRALKPELCCCFMSDDGGAFDHDGLLMCAGVKFFPKPFDVMELAKDMRELTGMQPARESQPPICI